MDAGARFHWAYREIAVLLAVAVVSVFVSGRIALDCYMRVAGISDVPTAIEGLKVSPYWALAVQSASWIPVLCYIHFVVVRSYRKKFRDGIGWLPLTYPAIYYLAAGALLVFSVTLMAMVIGVPDESYPMLELFEDREALWVLGAFGVLVAPVIEEIVFRGFLFAAFEHVHGLGFALAATSLMFSLVHGSQYGWQWQNLLILFWVGLILGAIRARTGSTKATTLVHACYNGLIFAALFALPEQLR